MQCNRAKAMKTPDYWKSHYVTSTDPAEVELALKQALLDIGGESLEVIYFLHATDAPNVLISQGSGGHGYVFAELAYRLHLGGFNVFVMPKHGGRTVNQLVDRHLEVLQYIHREFNEAIGLYGEGLGGYLAFYLALAHAPIASLICQNAPAILTEPAYHRALSSDRGPWAKSVRRRRAMLPLLRPLALVAPRLQVPISSYLSWKDLIDTSEDSHDVERRMVLDGYLKDPDFDRWYPLSAVLLLINTPPPALLEQLKTPTMFVLASQGPTPDYIVNLYERLPPITKKLVQVNGSVYWMLSHPQQAAALIADWFSATLRT
jgi:pimeloyl-ACP methyl ester carboxylesterase